MYGSRTDKAHSQNGGVWERTRHLLDECWPERLVYKRTTAKAEVRKIVADELDTPVVITTPGLKTIARAQRAEREAARQARWDDLMRVDALRWREIRLADDCEFGCKLFERDNNGQREFQVQHNSTYGCHKENVAVMPEWEADLLGYLGTDTRRRVDYEDGVSALIPVRPQPRRHYVEHHAPRNVPVTHSARARASEGSLPIAGRNTGKHTANFDHHTPSLMQMAAARAKSLGINK